MSALGVHVCTHSKRVQRGAAAARCLRVLRDMNSHPSPSLFAVSAHRSFEAAEEVVLRVGLGEEQLDSIGDVHKADVVSNEGTLSSPGAPLLNLHWEGFLITAADELYHTKWANATGVEKLTLPFAARILQYNREVLEQPAKMLTSDKESWLVRVGVSRAAYNKALTNTETD